jgi:hypothetical protein
MGEFVSRGKLQLIIHKDKMDLVFLLKGKFMQNRTMCLPMHGWAEPLYNKKSPIVITTMGHMFSGCAIG